MSSRVGWTMKASRTVRRSWSPRRRLRRRPEFVFPAEPRPGEHPRGDRLRPGGVSDLPVLSAKPLGTRGWRDANADDRVAYHKWRRVSTRVGRGFGGRHGRVRLPRSTRFTGGRSSRGCRAEPDPAAAGPRAVGTRPCGLDVDAGRGPQGRSPREPGMAAANVVSPLA